MKTCSKCSNIKDINCFSKRKAAPDGFSYWCKDCNRIYRKNLYNKDLEISRERTNNNRAARIAWFQSLKYNMPCADCNKIYEPYCMDYDHISDRGKKLKNVSRMVLNNTAKEIILQEIQKCELVCVLCHNKRTYNRFNDSLGNDRKYDIYQQRNINIINKFKESPCVECGIQYKHYNMQADHIAPLTKLYNICDLKNYKEQTLYIELGKCQVLCALCHRKKSIIEQQDNKYSFDRYKKPKRQKLFHDPIFNTKECGICYEIKNAAEFPINKKTKLGLHTYCKNCFNEYRRQVRKAKIS